MLVNNVVRIGHFRLFSKTVFQEASRVFYLESNFPKLCILLCYRLLSSAVKGLAQFINEIVFCFASVFHGNMWCYFQQYLPSDGIERCRRDDCQGKDTFTTGKLGIQWGWYHNLDMKLVTVTPGKVRLSTATVSKVDDIYQARNTLTHRILGPASQATILLDYAKMADGDPSWLSIVRR